MKSTSKGFFCAALVASVSQMFVAQTTVASDLYTIKDGKLERPTGYREWVFVGTPLTPNDMNNGKATFPEFHNVYLDRQSWNQWKEKGTVRDGAIMVKEMVSVGTKSAPSGSGYFEGDYIGLEISIKDSKHFPKEPGNWAYFSFTTDGKTLKETTSALPTEKCNACHAALAADDFMFTQYYPVLRAGKGTGIEATGGFNSKLTPAK
ncbi:cytochrome P460 family protein [Pseudomonas sp.]|uniref:cytochrome P460 family protein n=1 Tax=Pseudomonas sp. TaxID=306 RepID=UPI003A96984A